MVNPDIISVISGVKIEIDYYNTVGPELQLGEELIKYIEHELRMIE